MIKFLYWFIPRYGNWGGPNHSGGRETTDSERVDWNLDPKDSLDEIFKKHDKMYQHYDEELSADEYLIYEINNLEFLPWNWDNPPRSNFEAFVYRFVALRLFRLKVYLIHRKQ